MAKQLGLDGLRARALVTVGTSRVAGAGDAAGIAELEEAVELATQAGDVSGMIRAHNNLGVMQLLLGNAEKARAHVDESQRIAEHFGHRAYVRFAAGGPSLAQAMQAGQWDEPPRPAGRVLAQGAPPLHTVS